MDRLAFSRRCAASAIATAIMLLLSVGLIYMGVTGYASYLQEGITDTLPPRAAAAYRMLSENKVPDGDSPRILFEHLTAAGSADFIRSDPHRCAIIDEELRLSAASSWRRLSKCPPLGRASRDRA